MSVCYGGDDDFVTAYEVGNVEREYRTIDSAVPARPFAPKEWAFRDPANHVRDLISKRLPSPGSRDSYQSAASLNS